MTIRSRRLTLLALAALCASLSAPAAWSQAWPSRVIRIQVGFAPGGPTDNVARNFATKLSTELGQQVIVENKPGAGGTLAAAAAAKAPADGYTLLFGEPGSIAVNPAQTKVPYDPLKDFIPLAQVVSLPMVLVASPSLKVNSLAGLIAAAKAKPLPFGTPGNGTMQHLVMMDFGQATGASFTHVAYKGGPQALTDLLGGQIPLTMITVPTVLPHVKNATVVPLAVVAPRRSAQLPQVPTFTEAGFPAFVQDGWQGFFAPAGTPAPVVARLVAAIQKVGKDPELVSALTATGANVVITDPQDFAATLTRDVAYWARVVAANPAAKD